MSPVSAGITFSEVHHHFTQALAAVLKTGMAGADAKQETIVVFIEEKEHPNRFGSHFQIGPNNAWATGCLVYAVAKLAALRGEGLPPNTFVCRNGPNQIYGGGIQPLDSRVAVSGLSEEADTVVAAIGWALIWGGATNTDGVLDEAKDICRGADISREELGRPGPSCMEIFEAALPYLC